MLRQALILLLCGLICLVNTQSLLQGQLTSASVAPNAFSSFTAQITSANLQAGPVTLNVLTVSQASPALFVVIDTESITTESAVRGAYRGVSHVLVPSSAVVARTWNIGVFNYGNQTVDFEVTYLLNPDHTVAIGSQLEFSLAPGELHFANAASSSQFVIRESSLLRVEVQYTTVGGDLLQQSDPSNLLSFLYAECGTSYRNTGSTCEDIDQCETARCRDGLSCTNLPGSYECTDCPAGFVRDQGGICFPVATLSWYPSPNNSPLVGNVIHNDFNYVTNEQTLVLMRESFPGDYFYFSFFNAANVSTNVKLNLFYIDRGTLQLDVLDQATVGSNQWTLLEAPFLDIDEIPSVWTEALLYFEFQVLNPTTLTTPSNIVVVPFFNNRAMPDVSDANQLDQTFSVQSDWSLPQLVIGGRQLRNATFWKDVLFGVYFNYTSPVTLDISVTTRLHEVATAPLFRFTPYTANDFTSSMIFQFDLQPHFIEILDTARDATVMKVTMATAEQISDETVSVAIRHQGVPTVQSNDGLITGTNADMFFDLPVDQISGSWFVLANATSMNTGNAYDFQIRPAVFNRFDINVGEFLNGRILPGYWQYYRTQFESTTVQRGLFVSLYFVNYVSGNIGIANRELSFVVSTGNTYPTLIMPFASSKVYFTDEPIDGVFVPTYMGVYIPFSRLPSGLQTYTTGVLASERSSSTSHNFEFFVASVEENDIQHNQQFDHQLGPDTLRYYNVAFDEVAGQFPNDNDFILHTRFVNRGPIVLSSVVSKMDQFPLIPPKVEGDGSIVLNNTQVSQFTSLTRAQSIGRFAHIAVRNWHTTQTMSYSITAGFAPLRNLALGTASSIELEGRGQMFFTVNYPDEHRNVRFDLSLTSQSPSNFGATITQGTNTFGEPSQTEFSNGAAQLSRSFNFDTIEQSNTFHVLVQNPTDAKLTLSLKITATVVSNDSPVAIPASEPVAEPLSEVIAEPDVLSTGQIWAIVLGCIGGALVLAVAIFLIVRRVKQRNNFESVGMPMGYVKLDQ